MARKCKEDAEKTRLAIINAALDVFSEKGYARATFDEIALRAGFTKGAVYWYFKNKVDLISELIVGVMENKRKELGPQIPEGKSFDDLLEYFVLWAEVNEKDEQFAKFNRFVLCQMEWSEAIIKGVEKNITTAKNWHLEKIKTVLVEMKAKGLIKEGLDIEMLQHVILATYLGIVFSFLSKRQGFSLSLMIRTGLGLLFDSIRK